MKQRDAKKYLQFVQAAAEGKQLQVRTHPEANWQDLDDELSEMDNWLPDYLRIKPEPKLRPWHTNEIPVGAWIRHKASAESATGMILGREPGEVQLQTCSLSPKRALDEFVHSTDNGKTWLPCGIQEP